MGSRNPSVLEEIKIVKKKGGLCDFFIPKLCEDYLKSEKSFISIKYASLIHKSNILAMDFGNHRIFSFSSDGDFYTFNINTDKKTFEFA